MLLDDPEAYGGTISNGLNIILASGLCVSGIVWLHLFSSFGTVEPALKGQQYIKTTCL